MPLPPDTVRRLDHRLATAQKDFRLPSVVALLIRGGDVVWTGGAGRVDDAVPTVDTQYRIGSITKTFVAVAIMQLRDAGTLALDDAALDHLGPEWASAREPLARVRIGQLLMHTAGLCAETTGPWWERTPGGDEAALAADVAGHAHPHVPGSRFHYSNVGFGILGAVLAHHHERSWTEAVERDILTPLGMTRTTPRPEAPFAPGLAVHPFADVVLPEPEHDAGVMSPAGQLWSTLTDLAIWARFLAGAASPDHRNAGAAAEVLSDETLAEMSIPGAVVDIPNSRWTTAHGLGLQVFNTDGTRWVGHGGSMPGFIAGLQSCPSTKTGVVVATNTTNGLDPALMTDLVEEFEAGLPTATNEWTPVEPPRGALDLTGVWYWGPTPLDLTLVGTELMVKPLRGRGRASSFSPREDGTTWLGHEGYYAGEVLRAVRGPDGTLTHLNLASFVLTREPYQDNATVPGGVDPAGWRGE